MPAARMFGTTWPHNFGWSYTGYVAHQTAGGGGGLGFAPAPYDGDLLFMQGIYTEEQGGIVAFSAPLPSSTLGKNGPESLSTKASH